MIYFLQRTNGDIKIGTTISCARRFSVLTSEHGELIVLGIHEGDVTEERQLHLRFAKNRCGITEFFEQTAELLEYIHSHAHLDIPPDQGATTHIPMTPSAKREIRDFARGLDATYSEAVMMLLQLQQRAGETALEAGMRLQRDGGQS